MITDKKKKYNKEYWPKYYLKNKTKILKKNIVKCKKWREKHKEHCKMYQKEYQLFNRKEKARLGKMLMLFELGGCCVFDFETDPFKLEIHHPFGRKKFPDVMIQVCHKHHTILDHEKRSKVAKELRRSERKKGYWRGRIKK